MQSRRVFCFCPIANFPLSLTELKAAGWEVHTAENLKTAKALLEKSPYRVGLICLDADSEFSDVIIDVQHYGRDMTWIILLPKHRIKDLSLAIVENLFDFHTFPIQYDRLLATMGHGYAMAEIRQSAARIEAEAPGEEEMVGSSPVMLALFKNIRKVAGVDSAVLITGESGTGKEQTALAIHERSARGKGPFIAVNCGGLPASLIQSELFGHEKGAFTGAYQRKVGRIEAANGGTIFLDEIGDLPLDMQANLLRFLQEKTIERIGSVESIHVDVRVVAATHVDLEKAVKEGRFREDLYYRLNTMRIHTPALRDRQGDIELLAKYFFTKFSAEHQSSAKGFTQDALKMMNCYHWPGNVRQMINCIRRAVVMCEKKLITPADLGLERRSLSRKPQTLDEAREAAEKLAIQNAMGRARNSVSSAAKELGVSRMTLYRLLEKYQMLETSCIPLLKDVNGKSKAGNLLAGASDKIS